jgi:histidinol-phosphatase
MEGDLAFAHELADLADSISMAHFRSSDLVVETKPDMTPVSEADKAVERALRDKISAERPGDAVVGEEFGDEGPAARRWILDPIDGTKSYVRGLPVFATLIALEEDGELLMGLASAPALGGRRWWAVRGGGAFADGGPIHVSRVSRLADAQLLYAGLRTWKRYGLRDRFLELVDMAWRSRGLGDFWMHMLVAEGAAEVAVEMEVNLWDLAPAKVIIEEAGGRFTDLSGRPRADGGSALSSNGLLHEEVLRVLGVDEAQG